MLNWVYIPYTLPLLVCGALALAVSGYTARHRDLRGANSFMWFCLAVAEWAFAYALDVAGADEATKVFWSKFEYLGIVSGPLFWLAFALAYTGRANRLSRRVWLLLSVIPVITVLLVFTNDAHQLIWQATPLDEQGPLPILRITYGPWFWVHTATSYFWTLIGSLVLLGGLIEARQFYRRRGLAVVAAIVLPWISNILYIAKLVPVPGLDLTPLAATLGAVAIAWALFRFRLLDLVPVARRAMLDSMNDAVIALDTQNRIVDLNQAAARFLGVAHNTIIGQPAGQILQNHIDLVERFRYVTETRAEIVRETAHDPHIYELQIAPLRDGAGEMVGRLITLHDITERKRAQEEIQALNAGLEERVLARTAELAAANQAKDETLHREQAARAEAETARRDLAFLAEASRLLAGSLDEAATLSSVAQHAVPYLADGCAIHVMEEGGRFRRIAVTHAKPAKLAALAALEQRYPTQQEAPYGFPHVALSREPAFHAHVEDGCLREMARDAQHLALLRTLELQSYMCLPLVARERTLGVLTLVRGRPGPDYSLATLALAQDLAQRIALALDNAQLYRAARQAVQVRDEFLSVASHELKTPLTSLLLAVHAVLRITRQDTLPAPDYLTRRLTMVEDQSKRLAALVNNLLDISRITAGRLQLEPQEVDLTALARQVLDQFQEELNQADCPVTLEAAAPVRGTWDRARIEQVVTNLLTNAMKYGQGHPIAVTVAAEGPMARLSVCDQGIGIAPEQQERIFGRFERAVAPGKYGGMGLGLYIARQIVEAHGGSILVTSAPGQGATFTVLVPRTPD